MAEWLKAHAWKACSCYANVGSNPTPSARLRQGFVWQNIKHIIMWYVYILKRSNNTLYIGSTNNLRRRLAEHQQGKSKSTTYLQPIILMAYISVSNEQIARSLEKYLKTGSGKAFLKKRILTDEAST